MGRVMVGRWQTGRAPATLEWEFHAEALGSDAELRLAALAGEGWVLVRALPLQYGSLTAVGYFRRRPSCPHDDSENGG